MVVLNVHKCGGGKCAAGTAVPAAGTAVPAAASLPWWGDHSEILAKAQLRACQGLPWLAMACHGDLSIRRTEISVFAGPFF